MKKKNDSLITDSGMVEKKSDPVGRIMIVACTIVIIFLVYIGVNAFIHM